jgi:hypothetical protein
MKVTMKSGEFPKTPPERHSEVPEYRVSYVASKLASLIIHCALCSIR